jgi:hypothetical protein
MRRNPAILFVLVIAGWATAGSAAPPAVLGIDEPELDVPLEAPATPRARKAELLARAESLRGAAPAKTATPEVVNCATGDSLQKAIDKSTDDATIEVRGLCHENVRIERRRLTLRGVDPAADGIRGVAADPPVAAALEIWYSGLVRVENLSIRNPEGIGLGVWHSGAEVRNCQMTGNATIGVHLSSASFLNGTELDISGNGRQGLNVQRNSLAFCRGCRLENNATWAAVANFGALLSVLDGVITGGRGIQALNGSYADIDCVTEDNPYPCSLNVTATAAFAIVDSTAAMWGAGPFAGQLVAFDRGEIYLFGAQQTATGVGPAGNPRANVFEHFSTLVVEPHFDAAGVGHQGQLAGSTHINTFSRALLIGGTAVNGSLSCTSAGDAWADAEVTVSGGAINGCEHVPPPAP